MACPGKIQSLTQTCENILQTNDFLIFHCENEFPQPPLVTVWGLIFSLGGGFNRSIIYQSSVTTGPNRPLGQLTQPRLAEQGHCADNANFTGISGLTESRDVLSNSYRGVQLYPFLNLSTKSSSKRVRASSPTTTLLKVDILILVMIPLDDFNSFLSHIDSLLYFDNTSYMS